MPERPLLKPWYRLAETDGRLVLEYAHKAIVLEGEAVRRLLPALLPLLDGTRTVDEVVAVVGEPVAPAARNALELLAAHDLLAEAFPQESGQPALEETACFAAAVSARGASPPEVAASLAGSRVAVAGEGAAAEAVGRLLRLSGVGDVAHASLLAPAPDADLAIVAPSSTELPRLPAWNEAALEAGTTWLALLPFDGRFAAVGPLFVANETCCYECYRLRRASSLGYWDEFWRLERETAPRPFPPAAVAAAAGLAVVVTVRWLVERDPRLPGVLFALELAGPPGLGSHRVYRVPRCPCCSEAARVGAVLPWYERDEAA
jgi:bacteriocin biosynthesis cyclodehydratase domain-containing protein